VARWRARPPAAKASQGSRVPLSQDPEKRARQLAGLQRGREALADRIVAARQATPPEPRPAKDQAKAKPAAKRSPARVAFTGPADPPAKAARRTPAPARTTPPPAPKDPPRQAGHARSFLAGFLHPLD